MSQDSVKRLGAITQRVAAAERTADRASGSTTLIAVSKTYTASDISPILHAGHRCFGENRVQEAKGKWPALRQQFPDIALHLIGRLQSNKAKEAVQLFDCIHTIDRPKIAQAIAAEMKAQCRTLQLFVQVNTGEEPQKAGIMPADAPAFIGMCRNELGISLAGLMCIPPVDEEPAIHFAFLAKLAREQGLAGLSIGMSADFETAIAFGATHVRVGSAIFGARD